MKLITINSNPMGQNIYLYFDEATKEGVVIDPGHNLPEILAAINENNINIKGILLTHGHYDHISAVNELKEKTNADVYCHCDEKPMLENPAINLSVHVKREVKVTPDMLFDDGDDFEVGKLSLTIIHTPGHTPGGVCYYDEDNEVIFTGDTLFRESIGRTDLPGSDHKALNESIKNKLLCLPANVTVYPGHGRSSGIGHEIKQNPFLR